MARHPTWAGDRRFGIDVELDTTIDTTDADNLLNELVAIPGQVTPSELVPAMLNERTTVMFTEGDGKPRTSGKDILVKIPTLKLLKLARQAIFELFEQHAEAVQISWGTAIDMEEALGYVIGDALGVELLLDEARAIGKRANNYLKEGRQDGRREAQEECFRAAVKGQ